MGCAVLSPSLVLSHLCSLGWSLPAGVLGQLRACGRICIGNDIWSLGSDLFALLSEAVCGD